MLFDTGQQVISMILLERTTDLTFPSDPLTKSRLNRLEYAKECDSFYRRPVTRSSEFGLFILAHHKPLRLVLNKNRFKAA